MAYYTPPGGHAVAFDFGAAYTPPGGHAVAFDFNSGLTVGATVPDDVETLVAGATYYRRIIIPYAMVATTIMFQVNQTSGSTNVTGSLYSDSGGSVGSLLASSAVQNGTVLNLPDDLPLLSQVSLSYGITVWVAITISAANVQGKIKSGGKGKKDTGGGTVDVPNAYAIWLVGTAVASPVPVLAIGGDVALSEGASGTTNFSFDVSRQIVTTGTTTVDWAVTGSGANPAIGADFVGGSLPSGTVTFLTGETLKQIVVAVAGDSTVEPDEGFVVTLSNASGGATIGTATSNGTILNDDVNARRKQVLMC